MSITLNESVPCVKGIIPARTSMIDLAWAAGLFEGEGCMTKAKRSPVVSMVNTDLDVVQRFHAIVGKGTIHPKPRIEPGRKPLWTWSACGENALALIDTFLPFFGERRKARALELIEWRRSVVADATRQRDCLGCGQSFIPSYTSAGRRQSYCTPDCRLSTEKVRKRHAQTQRRFARQKRQREVLARTPRHCVQCGALLPSQSRTTRAYCSGRCASLGYYYGKRVRVEGFSNAVGSVQPAMVNAAHVEFPLMLA